uniref:Uncharacterized protein n=1 Tax=Ditylenchus dipsaci TaxID=166011 RepID=A0A915DL07_9BILA
MSQKLNMNVAEQYSANDLDCSICMELFEEPKILPCGHIFCHKCVLRIEHEVPLLYSSFPLVKIKCPTCRSVVSLPQNGLLPTVFLMKGFVEKAKQKQAQNKLTKRSADDEDGECSSCSKQVAADQLFIAEVVTLLTRLKLSLFSVLCVSSSSTMSIGEIKHVGEILLGYNVETSNALSELEDSQRCVKKLIDELKQTNQRRLKIITQLCPERKHPQLKTDIEQRVIEAKKLGDIALTELLDLYKSIPDINSKAKDLYETLKNYISGSADSLCFDCGNTGHMSRECTHPRLSGGSGNYGVVDNRAKKCFNCQGIGHVSRQCSKAALRKTTS